MYVCMCNPFTDRDVKAALENPDLPRKTAASVYKACSGGEKPCCGSCVCMLKDMVDGHKKSLENAEPANILAAE